MTLQTADTAHPASAKTLGFGSTLTYAFGSLGTGVFSTVPTILLLYYCTEILRIEAGWAALIVFVPKVWSIVWDPFVGIWSDRTRSPWGRRRPFLAAGAFGVSATFVALFSAQYVTGPYLALYVGILYFAMATLYSLFAVPYTAIPAEIGKTPGERSRLVSFRMAFVMIGVLAGASVAPTLVEAFGGGAVGYPAMGAVIGLASGIAMLGPILMLGPHDPPQRESEQGVGVTLWGTLTMAVKNREFFMLAVAFLLQLTAVGIFSATTPYLIAMVLGGSEGDVGIAMGVHLLVTAVTVPFWGLLGRKLGERTALVIGSLLYASTAVLVGVVAASSLGWVSVLVAFGAAGTSFAALQVLPFTAAAHVIHEQTRTHFKAEAALTGVWTATEKLGLALGPAITGLAISLAGANVAQMLPVFLAIAPGVLLVLALVPLAMSRRSRIST